MNQRVLVCVLAVCTLGASTLISQPAKSTAIVSLACPVITPDDSAVVMDMYLNATTGDFDELREKLGLQTIIPDSLVRLETDDATCDAARQLYESYVQVETLDQVVVVRVDTMRAILKLAFVHPDSLGTTLPATLHLFTDSSLVVKDSLWY